ncbi:MAG: hypothetical protein U0840_29085 [Gemmataceae bacterium]
MKRLPLCHAAFAGLLITVGIASVSAAPPDAKPGVSTAKGGGLLLRMDCHNLATDARTPQLADYPDAVEVRLAGHEGFTDDGLKVLPKLRKLRELQLTGENISAAGFTHLADHPSLVALWLHLMPLGEKEAGAVARIRGLERLGLKNQKVAAGAWVRLADLPRLRALTYSPKKPLTADDVTGLGRLTRLDELVIQGADRVTLADLAALKAALPNTRIVTAVGTVTPR